MRSGPRDSARKERPQVLDPIRDKEWFDKAQRIITLCGTFSGAGPITKLEKTGDGFYRAYYTEYGPNETTSLLDLNFPFAKEDFETALRNIGAQKGIQTFLSLGAGMFDYPKKRNKDPQETRRAYFVVDPAYGLADDMEIMKEQPLLHIEWHYTSNDVRREKPERTYLYNGFPYDSAKNAFDVVQMVNVLSEPKGSIFQNHRSGEIAGYAKLIKPVTGQLFILNSSTPNLYPLSQVKKEVEKLACNMEILIDLPGGGRLNDEKVVQVLQQNYHVDPIHFINLLTDESREMDEGTYAVVIQKPKASER